MSMQNSQVHYNAIRWVKSDLDQTLNEARAELDALIETPDDLTHLQQLRNLFREVHGVLDMVEVQGGVLLLEELRALLTVYADGKIRNQNETLDVVSRAILQLPDYLDYIERGNIDVPIVLLPLLNDLRTAREASLVSDRILVLPEIENDQESLDALPAINEDLQSVANALRPLFQLSLLGWYKNQSSDRNLLKIAAILHRLKLASKSHQSKRLWWISQAVAEALQCHALESSITVKSLFGKVDRLLKILISFGEEHLSENIQQELIKNLLFYVASANNGNTTVDAVKDAYQLNELGVETDALKLARASMSGPNQNMFASIAKALLDDVNEIKERVEVYALADSPENSSLQVMQDQLIRLADTLGMIGLNGLREKLHAEDKLLAVAIADDATLPREQIQGLANLLMDVEFEVSSYASGESVQMDESDDTSQIRLPEHEYQKILSSVIYETLILISHCKEAILSFVNDPGDRQSLLQIPELVMQVQGAMAMLPLQGVLPLVDGLQSYVDACIDDDLDPAVEELDALADIIVSVEFYLESLDAGKGDHQVILEKGAESLPLLMRSVTAEQQDNLSAEIDTATATDLETELSELDDSMQTDIDAVDEDVESVLDEAEAVSEVSDSNEPAVDLLGHLCVLPRDVDPEILEIFLEEAEEEIERINAELPRWLDNTSDTETLGVMRRSFHTLKGSGRLVGAEVIGEYAWCHEDLLNRLMENTVHPSVAVTSAVESGAGLLQEFLEGLKTGQHPGESASLQMELVTSLVKGEDPGSNEDEELDSLIVETPDYTVILDEYAIDPELMKIFHAESNEHIQIIDDYVEGIRHRNLVPGPDDELYRALHTLNGSARTADFSSIYSPCALAEAYALNCNHAEVDFDNSFPDVLEKLTQHVSAVLGSPTQQHREEAPELLMGELQSLLDTSLRQVEQHDAEMDQVAEDTDADDDEVPGQEVSDLDAELDAAIDHAKEAEADEEEEYDAELIEIFVEEARELLDSSENAMATWQDEPTDLMPVRELQRYLHTIKGGARMAGFKDIGNLSHAMESLYLATVEGRVSVDHQVFDTLHGAFDQLQQMVNAASKAEPMEPDQDWARKIELCISGDYEESEENEAEAVADFVEEAPESDESLVEELPEEELAELQDVSDESSEAVEETVQPVEIESLAEEGVKSFVAEDELDPEDVQIESNEPEDGDVADESPVTEVLVDAEEIAAATVTDEPDVDELPDAVEVTDIALEAEVPVIPVAHSNPAPLPPKKVANTDVKELIRVRSELLDQLVNHAGEVNIYHSRVEEQVVNIGSDLSELEQTIRRLAKQLRSLEGEAEAQILSQMQRDEPIDFEASLAGQDFDPLELDRYSKIQQLSRGLAESIGDLVSIQGLMQDAVKDTETLLVQQSRVSTELQDGLMRTRMVPFNTMLPRMRRIVRQTAAEIGKEVELSISGEASEVDRKLLDSMTVPLEHMLRNAIAHGIETPEVRNKSGKRKTGSINVTVNRHGNEVVLLVEDDGAGIDVDQVRQKAKEKGLVGEDEDLPDEDIIQLILESGFSTADELTQVAGRGVGMDIVNTEIKQLNGRMTISSEAGKGTTFRITLPFTLAINQALLVQSDDDLYAIPMNAVEGVLRMSGEQLAEHISTANTSIEYAGQNYELKQLSSLLYQTDVHLDSKDRAIPVLLLRSSNYRIALLVSEVLGNREVVVKSLGSLLSTLASVSGATILGDGKVVLVLDVAGLVRAAMTSSSKLVDTKDESEEKSRQLVMVVDDSITIRKVTARMLERHNFQVITAKDGVDAVSKLQDTKPDLMLLDIEMPRMDGYELATHVRNQEDISDLPIIMITSRTGKKHKDKAFSLGVNQYLGKPYQEGELMENINAILGVADPVTIEN